MKNKTKITVQVIEKIYKSFPETRVSKKYKLDRQGTFSIDNSC